jgi:hypothetical protein
MPAPTNLNQLGTRYLLPGEKSTVLADWVAEPNSKDPMGDGDVDPEARVLLAPLNRLDGVCTVQSCVGHHVQRKPYDYVKSGHIELRLSEERTRQFYAAMPVVALQDWCEDICLHWRSSHQCALIVFRVGRMSTAVQALLTAFGEAA